MITDPSIVLSDTTYSIAKILAGDLAGLIAQAKELLKNKDIPLEVRWEKYCAMVRIGAFKDIETCADGFIDYLVKADGSHEESTLYDDFRMDRHETKYYTEMYDMMGPGYHTKPKWTTESIDDWRELVLASGYAGFEYDW